MSHETDAINMNYATNDVFFDDNNVQELKDTRMQGSFIQNIGLLAILGILLFIIIIICVVAIIAVVVAGNVQNTSSVLTAGMSVLNAI